MRILKSIMAASSAFFAGCAAHAAVITVDLSTANDGDDLGDVFFNGLVDGSETAGLTGAANFSFAGVSFASGETTVLLDVTLSNTSGGAITDSIITAFGFDTDPDLIDAGATPDGDPFDDDFQTNVFFPGGPTVEVCFSNNPVGANCSGNNAGGGVAFGVSEMFQIALVFSGDITDAMVTLDNFGVRYQGIDSSVLDDASGFGVMTNPPEIPVPAAVWAMGLGLAGLGGAIRRKQKAA
ncbi:MAG: cistern family PEP-CTERM protein [Hyphococcus sp.]